MLTKDVIDALARQWGAYETVYTEEQVHAIVRDAIAAHTAKVLMDVEPVAIYHGRCVIDCGEHGHLDMQLLKMIPAGATLYSAHTVAALAARVAELEKDAGRYRLLRRGQKWSVVDGIGTVLRAEVLDAAIDAAALAAKGQA